jgi:hypothetical protein
VDDGGEVDDGFGRTDEHARKVAGTTTAIKRAPARGGRRSFGAPKGGQGRYTAAPMLKVGGEVDSFCTRCQMTLAHTIHAIVGGRPVKVECNTCHGIHRYRGDAPADAKPARPGSPVRPARERTIVSFDETLRGKNLAMAQKYSPKARYEVDQVIEHPTFGLGWVSAVRDGNKVEVTFRSDVKVLVHGKA